MQVGSLASLSGLKDPMLPGDAAKVSDAAQIQHCCELWCRLQMRLGSHVAVALVEAGGYSSDSTPSLGTSICHGRAQEKAKRPKQKNKKKKEVLAKSFQIQ